ncbi:APC family permease [Corynebacterium pygosceleis]|uniref:APC family permease n=1 Tax=Corynebacterium pygosceleis TaxID=2800406 RepID=A0A9Q4CAH8_9CORY|nr:APC family permease [Corynebacterium pygosceleis]MCK7637222.1 APC family permease [Corynebacterium pygosceleis]MCK7676159.1 APC family permease [Corynebacterium pygosceleis]MCL0120003.1 APC family permease [Corynebacterium pygosceleis]MCX7445125.1 APC family permease [Corynebacterium pygosceleis]MCX7468450.1 APC family permease [Corynebacterium pygosceleis]
MAQQAHGLEPGTRRLTTPHLVFMIIAASAPLTVLAGGVPTNFAVSGLLGVPVAYLVLGILIAIFAFGYGAMSTRVQNAGAFYAYISKGLGDTVGVASSLVALLCYNLMQIGLYGLFGFALSGVLSSVTPLVLPWWATALLGWLCVGVLGIRHVELSARILTVLVALEFLVVAVVCVLGLTHAPEGISAVTLRPGDFFTGGVGVLLAFGIAAFMGFESGAIYSEETIDPDRTVSRATFIAVGVIALFYAFSAWAFSMGIGPSGVIDESREFGPDLMFVWLETFSPAFSLLSSFLFITSLFAALIAFHNASARYAFALGRAWVLPKVFGKVSHDGTPHVGSLGQSVLALIVIIIFAGADAVNGETPLFPVITLFTWLTNTAALGLVILLALTSFAIARYLGRENGVLNLWTRSIAPVISGIGLALIGLLVLMNFSLMIGDDQPAILTLVLPGLIVAAAVAGVIRQRQLIARTGVDHVEIP